MTHGSLLIELNKIYLGDALEVLKTFPDEFINCCVTSPPYFGLRDYGIDGQLGLEETPEEYVQKLVDISREVKRVLKKDGTFWLNLGDSYNGSGKAGSRDNEYFNRHTEFGKNYSNKEKIGNPIKLKNLKPKDLIGIPWMVAFALRNDGWYLRSDIIWSKPNPMPESVTDRPTKSHEYVFLLSKSQKYYYDYEAILEEATGYDGRKDTFFKGRVKTKNSTQTFAKRGHERWKYKNLQDKGQPTQTMHENRAMGGEGSGFVGHSGNYDINGEPLYYIKDGIPVRNKRSVWTINTQPFKEAHFAVFPEELPDTCIKAGCPEGGVVLDPFIGSGTTGLIAKKQNKNFIGIELNPKYIKLANNRLYRELGWTWNNECVMPENL
jgi:DNA modification methylase